MKMFLFFAVSLLSLGSFAQVTGVSMGQTFRQFVETRGNSSNGALPALMVKEETEGSPYLVRWWTTGMVTLRNKTVLPQPEKALNYNKETKTLILKISDKSMMSIDMNDIETFQLDDSAKTYTFVSFPEKPSDYYIAVSTGGRCSLYKTISTKFYRADYINKGQYETGYKYDRFVDRNTYYIRGERGGMIVLENLSRKDQLEITAAYPGAKEYIRSHPVTADKEGYLKDLVAFLNNPA